MDRKRSSRRDYRDYAIPPMSSGKLIATTSNEWTGIVNFVKKENFRREKDLMISREGWEVFSPAELEMDFSPIEADMPINLIAQFSRPNGERTLIIGTKTRLYRLFINFESIFNYFDDPTYCPDDYVQGVAYSLELIAATSSGNRWQFKTINGYAIMNNGVDLPWFYRVEWDEAVPMYELREQGILSVGTIEAWGGYLWCADIREIPQSEIPSLFSDVSQDPYRAIGDDDGYAVNRVQFRVMWSSPAEPHRWAPLYPGSITVSNFPTLSASRNSGVVMIETQSAHERSAGDVVSITGLSDGSMNEGSATITSVVDDFRFTYANAGGDVALVSDTGGNVEWIQQTVGVVERGRVDNIVTIATSSPHGMKTGDLADIVVGSGMDESSAEVVVIDETHLTYGSVGTDVATGSTAGTIKPVYHDNVYVLDYPLKSISDGMRLVIPFAGPSSSDLSTRSISDISLSGYRLTLDGDATQSSESAAYAADTALSNAGYDDLQANGGRILRLITMDTYLFVFREDGYFIGYPSGMSQAGTSPVIFYQRYAKPGMMPTFPDSIINDRNQRLIWLSRDGWFYTTLDMKGPESFMDMMIANNAHVRLSEDDVDDVFAWDNQQTFEYWFCTPHETVCYSYKHNDVSTIDQTFSAGASITKPNEEVFNPVEIWPVVSYGNRLYTSGFVSSRDGSSFNCTLKSGKGSFAMANGESILREYSLVIGSNYSNLPIRVKLMGSMTPYGDEVELIDHEIESPGDFHQIPTYFQYRFFSDEIVFSSDGSGQIGIALRLFNVSGVDSRGWTNLVRNLT